VAAVVPISQPHAIAAGLRYKAVAIALAASAATALIRLSGPVPGPVQDLRLPSRFASSFLRQPPTTRVAAVALEGASRNTCVMALGENGKLSVGFGELSRVTIVSLAACDLYNVSREGESTELLGGASLSARNIFLSGGYALAAGAVMTASRYLTTHISPVADPYSRLEAPLSRMHEEPLPAGRTKDRNHFAGRLLRRDRSGGRSYSQPRPRHLHPGPGQLRGLQQQYR
jgi:hypothetical protein